MTEKLMQINTIVNGRIPIPEWIFQAHRKKRKKNDT